MKVFSNCPYICFWMPSKLRSFERLRNSVPRISSQFGPHLISIRSPVSRRTGRATGMVSLSGAVCRCV